MADLVHAEVGMGEHIKGVLYHDIVLVGDGTDSCFSLEQLEKGGAAEVTELAELVDLQGLGVVVLNVNDGLINCVALHGDRFAGHLRIELGQQGIHVGEGGQGRGDQRGEHFVKMRLGKVADDLKSVIVEGIGVGEIEGDRVEIDLGLTVPDRIVFCVLGDIDQVTLISKIGISVSEKFAHALL